MEVAVGARIGEVKEVENSVVAASEHERASQGQCKEFKVEIDRTTCLNCGLVFIDKRSMRIPKDLRKKFEVLP